MFWWECRGKDTNVYSTPGLNCLPRFSHTNGVCRGHILQCHISVSGLISAPTTVSYVKPYTSHCCFRTMATLRQKVSPFT